MRKGTTVTGSPARAVRVGVGAIVSLLGLLVAVHAFADGRTDYLLRMLRQSSQYRVRVQAALSLGEIGDRSSVPALVDALGDEEAAVRVAALAALAGVGDPSTLARARERLRDPDPAVKRQARATVRALEQARERETAAAVAPGPTPRTAEPRFYIGLGVMGNKAGVRGDEMRRLLRQFLVSEVGATPGVVVTPENETPSTTTKVLQARRLTGYWVEGNLTKLQREGPGIRAEISLMVMTNPGRDLRMMLSGAASVSTSGRVSPEMESELQNQAVKGAATGAIRRFLAQLASGAGPEGP